MALTGIEIFKKLPKTNCGKCGVPTCLAFAMKLAAGQAELSACPFVSEQAKAELDAASAPPIRPLSIGVGEKAFKAGGEGDVSFSIYDEALHAFKSLTESVSFFRAEDEDGGSESIGCSRFFVKNGDTLTPHCRKTGFWI